MEDRVLAPGVIYLTIDSHSSSIQKINLADDRNTQASMIAVTCTWSPWYVLACLNHSKQFEKVEYRTYDRHRI